MPAKYKLFKAYMAYLQGNTFRTSVCRKLALAGLLCALCLVYYYYHISSNLSNHTVDLVAISSLHSFTAIQGDSKSANNSPSTTSVNVSHTVKKTVIRVPKTTAQSTLTISDRVEHTQTVVASEAGKGIEGSPKAVPIKPPSVRVSKQKRKPVSHYGHSSKTPHVLLLYGTDGYKQSLVVKLFLEAQRVDFIHTSVSKGYHLVFEGSNSGIKTSEKVSLERLLLVIFVANIAQYSSLQPYLDYCRSVKLPVIWATLPATSSHPQPSLPNLETTSLDSDSIIHVTLSKSYPFYYSRHGASTASVPSGRQWITFTEKQSGDGHLTSRHLNSNSSTTEAAQINNEANLASSKIDNGPAKLDISQNYRTLIDIASVTDHEPGSMTYKLGSGVIEDLGEFDGVRKILIGIPLKFWLIHLILLDAVHVLCEGLLRGGRERMVMVDIDDVFIAPEGRKMTADDVKALLQVQTELRQIVAGFTFNLGFVGGCYGKGLQAERLGDQELVRNADQLWWFSHTFKHRQPHQMTFTDLLHSMKQNREFAKEHNIPASLHHYSVSPHHSGVYPVHTPLYDAWKEVWNISVTTTEEYPHLRPDHWRRGFIHRGIQVLPRQTCRLFTHTFLYSHFTGGRAELMAIAQGGEVFMTLLHNPISIFMTHTPNYCCDRLALSLFPSLFQFAAKWTQLQFTAPSPEKMAERYFKLYPEYKLPLWTTPCDDKRHREIWSANKNCSRLPSLLILGPQKSGSTALSTFLGLHPLVIGNKDTEHHFEETQFFTDDTLYLTGIDWYMDQFPDPPLPMPNLSTILYEKSATYFTHPLAPHRAHSLLPQAKLIVILADPSRRAYSWYQHQRAHSEPAAVQHTFMEVLHASTPSPSTPSTLTALSHHCLTPAHYHQHIKQWLSYYDPKQLLLLDGDDLVNRPADVMDIVQEFLDLPPHNYHSTLQYDSNKGFYCTVMKKGKRKCLGKSKGRSYPPMTSEEHQWLDTYYTPHNTRLRQLLTELGRTPPGWLVNSALLQ